MYVNVSQGHERGADIPIAFGSSMSTADMRCGLGDALLVFYRYGIEKCNTPSNGCKLHENAITLTLERLDAVGTSLPMTLFPFITYSSPESEVVTFVPTNDDMSLPPATADVISCNVAS